MSNAFGGFLHTSPLSNLTSSTSRPPDPHASLASNCIRDHLGPIVQTVADALHSRGPSTLLELTGAIRSRCLKDYNSERRKLVDGLNFKWRRSSAGSGTVVESGGGRRINGIDGNGNGNGDDDNNNNNDYLHRHYGGRASMNKARGAESAGYVTDPSQIRASLVALLQHSLIDVTPPGIGRGGQGGHHGHHATTHYTYAFLPERARLLMRHSRYVCHVRDAMDEYASDLVENILLNGRMTAEDAISSAWEAATRRRKRRRRTTRAKESHVVDDGVVDKDEEDHDDGEVDDDDDDDGGSKGDVGEGGDDDLRKIMNAFRKLVEGGYLEMVRPIVKNADLDENSMRKKRKADAANDGIHGVDFEFEWGEDGTIVAGGGGGGGDDDNRNVNNKRRRTNVSSYTRTTKEEEHGVVPSHPDDDGEDGDKRGSTTTTTTAADEYHPRIMTRLSSMRRLVPHGSVYRVNSPMLHASLRALAIGRLASEMYPDDEGGGGGGGCGGVVSNSESGGGVNSIVPRHVGAIVCAALAYATRREYAPLDRILGISESEEERHDRMANLGTFGPSDIVPYLPPDVVKSLQSRMGGIHQNLSTLLVRMTKLQYPPVLMEVEEAIGHPGGGKFEVCTRQLLRRMRDRVQHRVLSSHHGIVASRVVSILRDRGHCESDTVAEDAMVPAREAREVLHRLHRDRYVDLFDMHMTKTHNTGTAIFLWDVIPSRLSKTVVDNVCTALLNLRLRRQHEVEVGKDWMDRAKESGSTEENFHEGDKRKFTRFCIGLDRLDRACLSLDETLMVLKDF